MISVREAARILGAAPSGGIIPGLWDVPEYPELTTGQLIGVAAERLACQTASIRDLANSLIELRS